MAGAPKTRVHFVDPDVDKLSRFDGPLGDPEVSDWREVHVEPVQTFDNYKIAKPVTPTTKRHTIYLQPLGMFLVEDGMLVESVAAYTRVFFQLETVVLPRIGDSFIPLSSQRIYTPDYRQFATPFILNHLQTILPDDAVAMMALTPTDLFPGNDWNFVFGQARTKARVAVSSFFRYKPDSTLDNRDANLLTSRMIKTCSHEIGHMFTIAHCVESYCVMNGSNSLWEADARPNHLCSKCLKKLQWNIGFKVRDQLIALEHYFRDRGMTKELTMISHDLRALQQ